MYKLLILLILLLFGFNINSGENDRKEVYLKEIVVTANRLPIPLEILDHIKYYEKYKAKKYRLKGDPRWYQGYGHMILPNEHLSDSISEQEAESLLIKDFLKCKKITANKLNMNEWFHHNKLLAVTCLAYNCGPYKILEYDLWDSLKSKGDCSIWLNYCCFNGKKHEGLLERRKFEYKYFKKD